MCLNKKTIKGTIVFFRLIDANYKILLTGMSTLMWLIVSPAIADVYPPTAAIHKAKCANIAVLYRDIEAKKRLSVLTPVEDTVLLSSHYCVSFFSQDKPTSFKVDKAARIASRYAAVGELLRSDAEKVAFAHLFLQQLSRKYAVLPRTNINN